MRLPNGSCTTTPGRSPNNDTLYFVAPPGPPVARCNRCPAPVSATTSCSSSMHGRTTSPNRSPGDRHRSRIVHVRAPRVLRHGRRRIHRDPRPPGHRDRRRTDPGRRRGRPACGRTRCRTSSPSPRRDAAAPLAGSRSAAGVAGDMLWWERLRVTSRVPSAGRRRTVRRCARTARTDRT